MLIRAIEQFLRRHGMSPSQFGRAAAQDPRLVRDMRDGRTVRPPMDQRLRGFMEGFDFAAARNPETPDAR